MSLFRAFVVAALEEVVAELAVELAGGEHLVADLEDRVGDGDHGALVAASLADPPVLVCKSRLGCGYAASGVGTASTVTR